MPPQGVIVVWEWEWRDFDEVIHISETSFDQNNDEELDEQMEIDSEEDSDETRCSTPVEHTVTFKCIGCTHDIHAQRTLQKVSVLLDDNEIVPVNIYPEPSNPYYNKAIAFKCWIDEEWHRIGYIVCEALDDVHEARTNNHITDVSFAWAKYLVSWTRSGPGYFTGINITKYGEWSSAVCACASTR